MCVDINDIYVNAVDEERAPFIRHLTPLSLLDDRDLPSPRIKQTQYFENKNPAIKKAQNMMKKFYKPVNFNDIIGSELDVITKRKLKKDIFRYSTRSERKVDPNHPEFVNLKEIISKAKCQRKGMIKNVMLSHLSPNRNSCSSLNPGASSKYKYMKQVNKTTRRFCEFIDNMKDCNKEKYQAKKAALKMLPERYSFKVKKADN